MTAVKVAAGWLATQSEGPQVGLTAVKIAASGANDEGLTNTIKIPEQIP